MIVGQQRTVMQFWLPFTAAEQTLCLLQRTPVPSLSPYTWLEVTRPWKVVFHSGDLAVLMQSFVGCCCSIFSDCLFNEERTWAEQLVLIESRETVCCWRTDGSGSWECDWFYPVHGSHRNTRRVATTANHQQSGSKYRQKDWLATKMYK